MSAATADRLRGLLTPVVAASGLDLESVDVTPAGRRRLVRVVVDKDGGVDARRRRRRVTRGLRRPRQQRPSWGRSRTSSRSPPPASTARSPSPGTGAGRSGRLVKVTCRAGDSVTGRVEAADAEGVDLDVDGHDRRLAYAEVRLARSRSSSTGLDLRGGDATWTST